MKVAVIIIALAISSAACKKMSDLGPPEKEIEAVDTVAILKYTGTFADGPYGAVSGDAKIFKQNRKYYLQFDNFKSSNGPNLHVYLSKEQTPVTYNDLGPLKSLGGQQVYAIGENLDDKPYSYICVYCVDFNHLFGYAKL